MIGKKYLIKLRAAKKKILPDEKVFLFGSSLRDKKFRDLDIGALGIKDKRRLALFREDLEDSTLPFLIDVVDFDTVSGDFRKEVFNHSILWL